MQEALSKELVEKLDESLVDKAKVIKAIEFAREHHMGQKRLSGEDFVCHPLKVAISSLENDLRQNTDIIVASLLHDVVEDTGVKIADIWQTFGLDIAKLVEGLSRRKKINHTTADLMIDSVMDKFCAPIVRERFRQVKLFTAGKTVVPYFEFAYNLLDALKDYNVPFDVKKAEEYVRQYLKHYLCFTTSKEHIDYMIKDAFSKKHDALTSAVQDMMLTAEMLHEYRQDDEELSVIESLTHVFNTYDERTVNKICLIKTLDRLDNLQDIHVFDEEKQKRIKENTVRDILPLASNQYILWYKIKEVCCKQKNQTTSLQDYHNTVFL